MNNLKNKRPGKLPRAISMALLSAVLFGLSTPFAKILSNHIHPLMLAGLLYLGSGLGLGIWILIRRLIYAKKISSSEAPLSRTDLPWLAGAIAAGGIIAPILLLAGLSRTPSSTASLLLNFESVFTLLLAWFVFAENFDRRIFAGAIVILIGGALLSWQGGESGESILGPILIAAACLAWGIDNNLTRRISAGDPVQIAAIKGIVAGSVNVVLALLTGLAIPVWGLIFSAGALGLLSYGLSLVLFVLSLRNLGAARTSAYFAAAPFIGAAASFMILSESLSIRFIAASVLMAIGVYIHMTERHLHEHIHDEMEHEHRHIHDEHHRHVHTTDAGDEVEHSHKHQHSHLIHSHPHYPDIHHRHGHPN